MTANQAATKVTKLDLMLVVDTTGSMGDEITYLQSELRSIIAAITARHRDLDIRIGFVGTATSATIMSPAALPSTAMSGACRGGSRSNMRRAAAIIRRRWTRR